MTTVPRTIKAVTGEDLGAMSDPKLATWQSGWDAYTANGILASREWDRRQAVRLMQEQFDLDQRLMNANVAAMQSAAILSVLGALLCVVLGAYLTKMFG
ncbi:hypothetical protein DIC66_03745 [Rhodoferax lacus]|uniref:Uncharacterized protein n=1 Tax=Rhodoferax lacus TaxID=2184758 RepID=A0A3E1RFQ3_9BURK|nr:hypothetical protein DIC66_03745 [Rhodoferax lacus]